MSARCGELLVIGLSLMTVAGAVYGLGDRAVLVPPPEMVVEEFVRKRIRCDPSAPPLSARTVPSSRCRANLLSLRVRSPR